MILRETNTGQASVSVAAGFLVAVGVLSTARPTLAHDANTEHDHSEYFIGLDNLNVLSSGRYTGLENPNYNRLTFLFAHREEDPTTNHFHGIGAYSYLGSVENPTINSTNTNNRIPEPYAQQQPLKLFPGTGIFTGRLISTPTNAEYSNLKIEPVKSLQNSPEAEDQYLFNSSNGRWQSSLAGATVGLQLVSISDRLNVANETGNNLFNSAGDTYTIGSGDNFSFTPTFWTDAAAPIGNYSATFKLVDLGTANNRTPFKESGTFSFDFQVAKVPEPSTIAGLGMVGLVAFSVSRLKKRIGSGVN